MPCGGCGQELILTKSAIELLEALGEFAFLPVGERDGRAFAVLPDGRRFESALTALKLYGLADVDPDLPLRGFDYAAMGETDRRGSAALTKRGQDALEALSVQGAE